MWINRESIRCDVGNLTGTPWGAWIGVGSFTHCLLWPLIRTTPPLLPGKGAESERSRLLSGLGWKCCELDAPTETARGDDPAVRTAAVHAKSSRTAAALWDLQRINSKSIYLINFSMRFILVGVVKDPESIPATLGAEEFQTESHRIPLTVNLQRPWSWSWNTTCCTTIK